MYSYGVWYNLACISLYRKAFLSNLLAQLWKETCDSRLENKKLEREWTTSPDSKYSITDVVKNEDKDTFMTVKQGNIS